MSGASSVPAMNEPDALALPAGLVAITGGERSGKTRWLRALRERAGLDALWLDLALPQQEALTPEQVWAQLQSTRAHWQADLAADLAQAWGLAAHQGKTLAMLSTGSRRKVALVGLLASGATVTCLDQPYAALDAASVRVLREFLTDMADHPRRTWVVADYEADARLPWRRVISLD